MSLAIKSNLLQPPFYYIIFSAVLSCIPWEPSAFEQQGLPPKTTADPGEQFKPLPALSNRQAAAVTCLLWNCDGTVSVLDLFRGSSKVCYVFSEIARLVSLMRLSSVNLSDHSAFISRHSKQQWYWHTIQINTDLWLKWMSEGLLDSTRTVEHPPAVSKWRPPLCGRQPLYWCQCTWLIINLSANC